MLDVSRQMRFVPGSNRKGDASGGSWLVLLDRLELGRTLFLGAPSAATLAMAAPLATDVMIWEPSAARRRAVRAWLERSGHTHVSIAERPQALWQLHELSADLVCRSRAGRDWPAAGLRRWVRHGGRIYLETQSSLWHRPPTRELDAALGNGSGRPLWLWLTPLGGEVRSAVPLADRSTRAWFARQALAAPNLGLPGLGRAERAAARRGLDARIVRRLGILANGTNGKSAQRPPLWLRELGHRDGIDLDAMRWGLWARGKYRSQKVLFFLFPGAQESPEYVVKMVRDAAFNARLENEYRALGALRDLGPMHRDHVPGAVFLGHPGGLAAVGESMVVGAPFAARTRGDADCPAARGAVEWLTALGAATARPTAPERVADVLRELLVRYVEIYQPEPGERAFLDAQIARIAASPLAVPAVFQHGDPGTWNMRVRPDGRVVFTDWEAFETRGMPLWDLFYFLRSYALVGRVRGLQGRTETFGQRFFGESPLSGFIHDAVERYAARVGLHPTLVEPLFYTCWMHRALKEASRLAPAKLGDGKFVQLLRHCIARRESPGLRRLFGSAAGAPAAAGEAAGYAPLIASPDPADGTHSFRDAHDAHAIGEPR